MGSPSTDNRNLLELVDRHYAVLYRYAYRLTGNAADAEDLTQQTFLTAQRKCDQLRDEESGRSWLFAIARNAYLKTLRSQPSVPPVSLESVGDPPDPPLGDSSVDSERLQAALNELTEDFRIPLILYYFNEFSYKDIARQMDLPMGTVMSRLARGKAFLRRRLANWQESGMGEVGQRAPSRIPAGSERESSPRK